MGEKVRRKPKAVRTRIGEHLERVETPGSHFDHCLVFSGALVTYCPRCEKAVAITSVVLGITLECGCHWHPPKVEAHRRKPDDGAWTSYGEVKYVEPT